ncbi:hypothetical protein V8E36_007493 [Tilletia maclaganii]
MPKRVLIVLAPLVILIEEIARSLGDEAVHVHAENRSAALFSDIKALKYRVIVMSPEMAASNAFKDVLREPSFQARLGGVILDECQVLKDWAVDTAFRRSLKDVSVIRHLAEVPGLAMSGTLPASYRTEVRNYFELCDPVVIDVGVDRPNIKLTIAPIRHSLSSFLDILAWIPELHGAVPIDDEEKKRVSARCLPTIIYVNNKTHQLDLYHAMDAWYSRVGQDGAVLLVSAEMSVSHRRRVRALVQNGDIKCVVSTSALGMGSDMRDIVRVIQWRIADSLSAIMQRIGRGGRDPSTLADGILLVDAWAVPKDSAAGASSNESDEVVAAMLAAEAGGDIDELDTGEDDSGRSALDVVAENDFAESVSSAKSNKKFKVDVELLKVIHRALKRTGCVRELVNQFLGQPPPDKIPTAEQIFGPNIVKDRPCCCVCDPEERAQPPEFALPQRPGEERARPGIVKLLEFVEPKLREWRVRMWRTQWSKVEDAPSWRGLAYFLGNDDTSLILKNLGKIDKALSKGDDPKLEAYMHVEAKQSTAPMLKEWLADTIAAFDAAQVQAREERSREADRARAEKAIARAMDKAKKKEDAVEAAKAAGSAKRINHCKGCVEWNRLNPTKPRRPTGGHNGE